MDKRTAERIARNNAVLEHCQVVDLSDTICALQRMCREAEGTVYQWNQRFAWSKMDVAPLLKAGWSSEEPPENTGDDTSVKWFSFPTRNLPGNLHLVLDEEDRWLLLSIGNDFRHCPWEFQLSPRFAGKLERLFSSVILELPPATLEEELSECIRRCPPLYTVLGKRIDVNKESPASVWKRCIHYWEEHCPVKSMANVFGLVRHITASDGKLAGYAMGLGGAGRNFQVYPWIYQACLILLRHRPEGCICTHYWFIACLLLDLELYIGAFYCVNISWLYTPTPLGFSYLPYETCAYQALCELLEQRRFQEALAVAEAAESCYGKLEMLEQQAEVLYQQGLILAAQLKNYPVALERLENALETICKFLCQGSEPSCLEPDPITLRKRIQKSIQACKAGTPEARKRGRALLNRYMNAISLEIIICGEIPNGHAK